MNALLREASNRLLEPINRVTEVLFGLIMVLTFTGSFSAAQSGQAEVHEMLIGALGCNLAWGLIDGIMFLMGNLAERATNFRLLMRLRAARTKDEAAAAIAEALPKAVAAALDSDGYNKIHEKLKAAPDLPRRPQLTRSDWLGALAVFLWVVTSTIPVVLPFLIWQEPVTALRISNAVAVALMFATGYAFGRIAGYRPLMTGGSMVLLGCVLVGITIALGG